MWDLFRFLSKTIQIRVPYICPNEFHASRVFVPLMDDALNFFIKVYHKISL